MEASPMTPTLSARRPHALALFGAALLFVLSACGSSSSGGNGGQQLTATDYQFNITGFSEPASTSVTVNLVNNSSGGNAHSFTIDSLSVETDVQPGNTGTVTFTTPASGTLNYHCKHHPNSMFGTITIGGAGGVTTNTTTGSGGGGYGY
jgi:plastocyanin